jgi:hypothetical protein
MFKSSSSDVQEVRQRAEEIRGSWSSSERRRRTGLPPDAPTKLRDYILALKTLSWSAESPAARC